MAYLLLRFRCVLRVGVAGHVRGEFELEKLLESLEFRQG